MKNNLIAVILFTAGMTLLFHQQRMGINLMVFEIALFTWFYLGGAFQNMSLTGKYLLTMVAVTALSTMLVHSTYSFAIHYVCLFLFAGHQNLPGSLQSGITAWPSAFAHIFNAQWIFLQTFMQKLQGTGKAGYYFSRLLILVLPLLVVFIFVAMYRSANPLFNEWFGIADSWINQFFEFVFHHFDEEIIPTAMLSFVLANFLLLRGNLGLFRKWQSLPSDRMQRTKKREARVFRLTAIKLEYRMALIALTMLNILLLTMNVTDVYWVWFNFEWEGQYLRQFVHEGTYVLILSILLSIAIVLYFFKGNINFLKNNQWLKKLSYLWLAQNALLALSVAIRNYWYIYYFALAYKRIGVILFLLLTFYGLWTVFQKVSQQKSAFYLIRKNFSALLLVLVLSAAVPWDRVIAVYNFRQAHAAFLHLDFMAHLSDNALPALDIDPETLYQIEKLQKEKFPFEQQYMDADEYLDIIAKRKAAFLKAYESRLFTEWNVADYQTYKQLRKD